MADLVTEKKKLLAFGTSHLILIIACFLSLLGSIYLYDSRRAERAEMQLAAAQTQAKIVDNQNQVLQAQTQQQITALAQQNQALQVQIQALSTAIAQRDARLVQSQQNILTLPPTQLAEQWGAAAQEPAPVLDTQGHFLVTLPLAQKSLSALETATTLQADKQDLDNELDKQRTIANNSIEQLSKEQSAHSSDINACKVDKDTLQSQITALKASARRSKLRWGVGGFLAGALTVLAHFI
jgi:hypothetical protein